jgi:hypothetical protein
MLTDLNLTEVECCYMHRDKASDSYRKTIWCSDIILSVRNSIRQLNLLTATFKAGKPIIDIEAL